MKYWKLGILALGLFVIGVGNAQAATFFVPSDGSDNVVVNDAKSDDAIAAGTNVSIHSTIAGEVIAAGQTVTVDKHAGRSILAGGQDVTITDGAEYNTYVGGNTVTLGGHFGHDVYAAGNTIIVQSGTVIDGQLRLAGQSITIHGTVKGDVFTAASTLTSDASIGGDFTTRSDTTEFTGGKIDGNLHYYSPNTAKGLDRVSVKGETTRTAVEAQSFKYNGPKNINTDKLDKFMAVAGIIWEIFTLLLVGIFVLIMLTPKGVSDIVGHVSSNWVSVFLAGIATVFLTPVLIFTLFFTLVGIPLAFLLIALAFVITAVANALVAIYLGKMALQLIKTNSENMWVDLLVGILLVVILGSLPFIGWLVKLVIWFGVTVPVIGSLLFGNRMTQTATIKK